MDYVCVVQYLCLHWGTPMHGFGDALVDFLVKPFPDLSGDSAESFHAYCYMDWFFRDYFTCEQYANVHNEHWMLEFGVPTAWVMRLQKEKQIYIDLDDYGHEVFMPMRKSLSKSGSDHEMKQETRDFIRATYKEDERYKYRILYVDQEKVHVHEITFDIN